MMKQTPGAIPKSDESYWSSTYQEVRATQTLDLCSRDAALTRRLLARLMSLDLRGKRLLEVGAGGSLWLPYLARHAGLSRCVGLDYSEAGCELLTAMAKHQEVDLEVFHADMFSPPEDLLGQFDILISFGVVEHFEDLPAVFGTFSRFLSPGGKIFTLLPNMHGVLGSLTRRINRPVYEIHVPYSAAQVRAAQQEAALQVDCAAYFGSTGFSVLSSCYAGRSYPSYYLWMTRFSKALWTLEDKGVHLLPPSPWLSPYILSISTRPSA